MYMVRFLAATGEIKFAIHMGGNIYDYGVGLSIRNGKVLMAGTTNSPVITVSNSLDLLLVEID